jgi:hypothetical protein
VQKTIYQNLKIQEEIIVFSFDVTRCFRIGLKNKI